MEMTFTFPGGARVDGQVGPHVVKTDQPPAPARRCRSVRKHADFSARMTVFKG